MELWAYPAELFLWKRFKAKLDIMRAIWLLPRAAVSWFCPTSSSKYWSWDVEIQWRCISVSWDSWEGERNCFSWQQSHIYLGMQYGYLSPLDDVPRTSLDWVHGLVHLIWKVTAWICSKVHYKTEINYIAFSRSIDQKMECLSLSYSPVVFFFF